MVMIQVTIMVVDKPSNLLPIFCCILVSTYNIISRLAIIIPVFSVQSSLLLLPRTHYSGQSSDSNQTSQTKQKIGSNILQKCPGSSWVILSCARYFRTHLFFSITLPVRVPYSKERVWWCTQRQQRQRPEHGLAEARFHK